MPSAARRASRRSDLRAQASEGAAGAAGAAGGTVDAARRRGHSPSRVNTSHAHRVQRVSAKDSQSAQASIASLYHQSDIDRMLGVGKCSPA
jgi:hypothetical protein